jgi:hypothetical protein
MTVNRSTLYLTDDGRPMTPQEQLALLLDIGGLEYSEAAAIAGVATSTIATYRKTSKARSISPLIIERLEAHVLARIGSFAKAAGYELKVLNEKALT